nr:NADH-quinone oxidoreductase subunit C [uncultured bacterium]
MILEKIKTKFQESRTSEYRGEASIEISKHQVLELLKYLKEDADLDFSVLMDLCGVDYLWQNRKPRFEVVYHLYSISKNHRLRVKVALQEEDLTIPSVAPLWPAANWYEREAWDMFGIKFVGHPNLKRILLYEEFQGHPLRKDYPIWKRQPLIGPKN